MALISCPTCEKQISSEAKACPACGHPIQAVTIEQTDKEAKFIQLVAAIGFFVGVLAMFSNVTVGIVIMSISFIAFIYAKASAWWENG